MVENFIPVEQAIPIASQRYSEPRCQLLQVVKVAGVAWKWLTSVAVHSGPRQARHREKSRRDYVGLLVRSDLPLESSQVTQTPGPAKVHGVQDWAISAWMPKGAKPFGQWCATFLLPFSTLAYHIRICHLWAALWAVGGSVNSDKVSWDRREIRWDQGDHLVVIWWEWR